MQHKGIWTWRQMCFNTKKKKKLRSLNVLGLFVSLTHIHAVYFVWNISLYWAINFPSGNSLILTLDSISSERISFTFTINVFVHCTFPYKVIFLPVWQLSRQIVHKRNYTFCLLSVLYKFMFQKLYNNWVIDRWVDKWMGRKNNSYVDK